MSEASGTEESDQHRRTIYSNVNSTSEVLARYHLERKDFFEFIGKGAHFLNIILGMGVTISIISNLNVFGIPASYLSAFLVGAVSALSLLINPAYLQAKHEQSARTYLAIKKTLDLYSKEKVVDDILSDFHDARAENPPSYQVVYTLSLNAMRAQTFEEAWIVEVPMWRRLLGHLFKQSDWVPDRPIIVKRFPEVPEGEHS
ncbi:hypothetical protein ABWI01_08580 [Oceanicaulis alexandrii]|uniref:hypothetical protein n=1 Tax=Oceanicaulis alexandrii TaxID=153233 RepID=UPI0035CF5FF1